MLYVQYPSWLSPIIIPGLPFRWYAIMYLVAFAITYVLFKYQVKEKKLGISDDDILSFFFWAIVGLLVGARLFSAFIYDTHGVYIRAPWLVFWPFDEQGRFTGFEGMSFHGGLVGIVAALAIYTKVKKIDLLKWGDLLVYAIPLGYTFGRLGNFINGELWGRASDAPWAMVFPHAPGLSLGIPWVREMADKAGVAMIEGQDIVNLPRHPSQLYEAILEGLVLWVLMWFVFRKRDKFRGYGISWYLIGYGTFRFIIEYFREPDKGLDYIIRLGPQDAAPEIFVSPFNLSMGQILCFLMIVAGVGLYFFFRWRASLIPSPKHFDIEQEVARDNERENRANQRRKTRKKLR